MEHLPKVLMFSYRLSTGMLWRYRLEENGINLVTEPNMTQMVERAQAENPDLILLDFDLFDRFTVPTIRKLRVEQSCPMVVLLTAWNADSAVEIYHAGVDDCILKPVDTEVFVAKINAWLRQRMVVPAEMLYTLQVGKMLLDPGENTLRLENGILVRLTNIEFRLLYVLMSHVGRTFQPEDLIALVWNNKDDVCWAILKNTINRLRQKLESEPANLRCLYAVTGFGYKFDLSMKPGTGKLVPSQKSVESDRTTS